MSGGVNVSGSINATGIIAGGSGSKQIDCGGGIYTHNDHVSFNFTFTNVPKVFVSINFNFNVLLLGATFPCSITTTGFTVQFPFINTGNPTVGPGSGTMSWFAIG